jgi:hypothetical protein
MHGWVAQFIGLQFRPAISQCVLVAVVSLNSLGVVGFCQLPNALGMRSVAAIQSTLTSTLTQQPIAAEIWQRVAVCCLASVCCISLDGFVLQN